MTVTWQDWVAVYVDHALAVAGGAEAPPFLAPFSVAPHVAVCDACGDETRLICPTCGAGVHDAPCSERHLTQACLGEDHWPEWLKEHP